MTDKEKVLTPITDRVKTFAQRCDEHPEHEGVVTHAMVLARVTEEADELRETARELEAMCEKLAASVLDACHATAIYGDEPPKMYHDALARYQAMKEKAK